MRKILFTCNYGAPTVSSGGPNKIIMELINNLDHNKFNISYFSGHYKNYSIDKKDLYDLLDTKFGLQQNIRTFFYNNVRIYKTLVSSSFYLYLSLFKNRLCFQQELSKLTNVDILHAHDALSLYYFKEINSLKILTVHSKGTFASELKAEKNAKNSSGLFTNHWISEVEKMEKFSFFHSDVITFPSQAAKKYYLEDINLMDNNKDVRIIYNGVNLDLIDLCTDGIKILSELGIIKSKYDLLILNVAAHVPEKNIEKILDVIAELKKHIEKKFFFIQIGSGFLTKDLEKRVEKLQLKGNVKFIGKLSNNKVISIMKCCDIFLMASEKVIFDMVILEAMAAGMCVMATNEGGNKEIINDGVNGYLFEFGDMRDLIRKILSFVPGKTEMKAKLTAQKFSVQRMTGEYCKLYQEL